ncbi:cytochrome c oxidase subunit 4 [Serinicoccus kebangsaanensis]|uniref:cytochrome c oxidase subunit 4 n=1 Tax=Serinicoccus kebangsaanensis TaxID=2602069 RepID=UPI00124D7798|nr:cytochrome c oxidase subunit 4 [Serinicoccus kebangsaanensis]
MRTEVKIFGYLVPFFALATGLYAYFTEPREWVGIVGLLLTTIFSAFIAFYLWITGRKTDRRPEDDLEGEIADLSGDYGHFAPYSWWPLWLGLSIAAVALGLAVGWWLLICAAPFLVISILGWTFEFFRGEKAV